MNNKKATQKANEILDIMLYAEENNLNIHDRGDVIKILKALYIPFIDDELDEWMSVIQDAETYMDKTDRGHKSIKDKQVN